MKNKDLQIEESQLKEALKDEYNQLVNNVCSALNKARDGNTASLSIVIDFCNQGK